MYCTRCMAGTHHKLEIFRVAKVDRNKTKNADSLSKQVERRLQRTTMHNDQADQRDKANERFRPLFCDFVSEWVRTSHCSFIQFTHSPEFVFVLVIRLERSCRWYYPVSKRRLSGGLLQNNWMLYLSVLIIILDIIEDILRSLSFIWEHILYFKLLSSSLS